MEGGEEQAEELRALYAELEKGFTKLDRVGSPEQQKRLLKQLTGKMAEAKRVIKEFEREARMEGMPQSELAKRKNGFVTELSQFMLLKKAAAARIAAAAAKDGHLALDVSAGPSSSSREEAQAGPASELQQMSNQQLVSYGKQQMDEADASLERSKKVVEDTINVGAETAAALQAQTGQMEKIVNDLDEVEFSLKKAKVLIRDLTRSLATDKCIMCFMLMIAIGVLSIIVLKVTGADKGLVVLPGEEAVEEAASDLQAGDGGAEAGRRLLLALSRLGEPQP